MFRCKLCYLQAIFVTIWQLYHPWRARKKPRFYFWRAQNVRKNKEKARLNAMPRGMLFTCAPAHRPRFPRIHQNKLPSSRKCCRPSLDLILFVPFVYLLLNRRAASLLVCVQFSSSKLGGGGMSTCWSYYSVRNVLATPKQKQHSPSHSLLLFMLFGSVCVRAPNTEIYSHAYLYISEEKEENGVGVYFVLSISLATLCSCSLLFFVSYVLCSCLSQRLRCGRVFWVTATTAAAAIGCVGIGFMPSDFVFNINYFW